MFSKCFREWFESVFLASWPIQLLFLCKYEVFLRFTVGEHGVSKELRILLHGRHMVAVGRGAWRPLSHPSTL